MEGSPLSIRFWGVRGSLPSPGTDTALVGGNTSCVEVHAGSTRIILDAGTGLRALGTRLVERGEHGHVNLLLSHVHWDHVMGLPFFAPIYMKGVEIDVACGPCGAPLDELLRRQMSPPMFPVDIQSVPSKVRCRELSDGQRLRIGDVDVHVAKLNHPDPVYGYRIEYGGRSIVYATDTEHALTPDPRLVALARRADVLVYDAQYTPEEYVGATGLSRRGWGHSTNAAAAELAMAADVRTLALFHHDPMRTDEQVADIVRRTRSLFSATVAAREGLSMCTESFDKTVEVGAPSSARG